MSGSDPQSFHIWPEGVHSWFERKIRWSLSRIRDFETNDWWLRQALADREIFEWAVAWYCGYMDNYIKAADPDEMWVSDVDGNDRRIGYDSKAVCQRIHSVVRQAQAEAARNRDAQKYPDLDSWLTALDAEQLEWDGPSEKDGQDLVAGPWWEFRNTARRRRKNWPKLCRICGAQFRPKPANVKSCEPCLVEMRAKRRAGA